MNDQIICHKVEHFIDNDERNDDDDDDDDDENYNGEDGAHDVFILIPIDRLLKD